MLCVMLMPNSQYFRLINMVTEQPGLAKVSKDPGGRVGID